MESLFDLAFTPQINEFNGRRMIQLKVLDWKTADSHLTADGRGG
jgi:hypothetical protein